MTTDEAELIAALQRNLELRIKADEAKAQLARAREALRKEVRSAEMQAAIMRDPARIGDGPPAHHKLCERVADAFERTAERMSAALKDADNGAVRTWKCAARVQGTAGGNDPADCDYPHCGCDEAQP